ncbi:DNA-binding transcriptional regulator KdgR [Vibrio marisflavi]|uniref:Transcriptional regulator KdgR n=1 Tax=Vibrio marisflavi CECT 7928 TaxID=634439 RepID=A0ABM9A830_9VIBR|nr:DNA-binding transcriptional regulator KdgR [Vibrio marisflavi]CAH0541886.1 Transcriptional regulator KdgR [Vibrio marisflavi CECT 7928]
MAKSTQPEAVSSVLKVFHILQALGEQKEIGVSELSQRLMMSKATTYRFLQTMKGLGYVSQQGEADKYSLTIKLFELGSLSLEYLDLVSIADKEMRVVAEQTNEALHLGIMDEGSIVYVHKIDSGYNLRMYSRIGRRNPLYCTAIGKVLLSGKNEVDVRKILEPIEFIKHTDKTIESTDQLLAELEQVKEQGFAEDNEEQEIGIRCIAVPVYDRLGQIIASASISFPTIRFDETQKQSYVAQLKAVGKQVSAQLGFYDYPA